MTGEACAGEVEKALRRRARVTREVVGGNEMKLPLLPRVICTQLSISCLAYMCATERPALKSMSLPASTGSTRLFLFILHLSSGFFITQGDNWILSW